MALSTQIPPTHPYGVVQGTGGYVFEEWPDGRIRILSSPRGGAGRFITPDNTHYSAVKGEIDRIKTTGSPDMPGVGDFPKAAEAAKLGQYEELAAEQTKGAREAADMGEATRASRAAAAAPPDAAKGMADSLAARSGDQPLALRKRVRGQSPGVLDDWGM